MFRTFRLDTLESHGLTLITEADLEGQREEERGEYLQIPPSVAARGVLLVDCMEALSDAARELGLPLPGGPGDCSVIRATLDPSSSSSSYASHSSPQHEQYDQDDQTGKNGQNGQNGRVRLWVGVDSEWKATMVKKHGDASHSGASSSAPPGSPSGSSPGGSSGSSSESARPSSPSPYVDPSGAALLQVCPMSCWPVLPRKLCVSCLFTNL